MKEPLIIVNFKTYSQVEGDGAMELARVCDDVAASTGVSIAVCPPMPELSRIASEVDIPVLSQHVDLRRSEPRTGHITLAAIKAAGAVGTILNHSERRLILADLADLVRGCRETGLQSVVCTNDLDTSLSAAMLGPDYIAMEPPELIGGDISVTTANPGIVRDTVKAIGGIKPDVKVLTGAGVKDAKDLSLALELGTVGVLLASGIVRSKDPRSSLLSLCKGIGSQPY
jgi:triosephosphate isomerase